MTGSRVSEESKKLLRRAVGYRDLLRGYNKLAKMDYFLSLFDREPQPIADTNNYYESLERAPLTEADAIEYIRERTGDSDYRQFHERRFGEQLSLFSMLCQRFDVSRVLDVSTMPYTTAVMKMYRPELDLVTIDLPPEQGGPDFERFEEWGVDQHVAIDLNEADWAALADDVTSRGKFDVVLACEVVEHLQVDFHEVVDFCLSVIRPGGLVIITTPNFHSEWKLHVIAGGNSPQHRFHEFKDLAGAYHYREYTMKELRDIVNHAGGKVLAQVYSHALIDDNDRLTDEENYMFRENMVFVFSDEDVSLW